MMEILKVVSIVLGPAIFIFLTLSFLSYREVLSHDDFTRIPKRMIRNISMTQEEKSEIIISECAKLRKFIDSLDISLRDKQGLIWRIESIEEDSVRKISNKILEDKLKELKHVEQSEENK